MAFPRPLLLGALAVFPCTAPAIIDRDSNGLSDVWEVVHNTGPLTAALDSDADGFSNRDESAFGTDPLDPTSRPRLRLDTPGTDLFTLDWPGAPGIRYDILTAPSPDGPWTSAAALLEPPFRYDLAAGAGFFRIRASDLDTDGDGLSDWEELAFGFNPLRRYTEGIGSTSTSNPVNDFTRVRDALNAASSAVTTGVVRPWIHESDGRPGVVAFRRTGRLAELTVAYALGGTATPGTDYALPAVQTVTFPAGRDEVWLELNALADAAVEADETITVTLQSGAGYTLGTAITAALTLTDGTSGRPSAEDAARFLAQATFGATPDEITRVRDLGYAGWIDAQIARAPRLHLPLVLQWNDEAFAADPTATDPTRVRINSEARIEAWWRRAMADDPASDPLRQYVAYAWSQLFVISDRMGSLDADHRAMAGYYDLLVTQGLGNFRTLLEEVTVHPWMGLYLSHLRNRKADLALNRFPDENYAREVLQLFTIGLWLLNQDGTLRISDGTAIGPYGNPVPAGEAIPTYGGNQVTELARVFTGLSYGSRFRNTTTQDVIPTTRFNDSSNIGWLPMRMFDAEHDLQAKSLDFPGVPVLNLPARTASSPDTGAAGMAELDVVLDHIFAHPNVPPFVARHLIQRLVTSNPKPAYVARVAAVFANNGAGVRGDLAATVRAILLDPEARTAAAADDVAFGRVREPYVAYVALARAFRAAPEDVLRNRADPLAPVTSGGRYRNFSSLLNDFLQRPMSSPSVFNFYLPSFAPPGELVDAGLVAPEMQIINSQTSITGPNRFSSSLSVTSSSSLSRWNPSSISNDAATPQDEGLWNTRLDEAAWQPLAQGDPDLLVASLDRLLTFGRLSPESHRSITRSVRRLDDPLGTTDPTTRERRALTRLRVALHLLALSPEFAVQK